MEKGKEYLRPYLDQANPMIDRLSKALAGGPPITADEIARWKVELTNLLAPDDTQLLQLIAEVRTEEPERLVYIAGRILGKASRRRMQQEALN